MSLSKLKCVSCSFVVLSLLAIGGGGLAYRGFAEPPRGDGPADIVIAPANPLPKTEEEMIRGHWKVVGCEFEGSA